MGLLYLRFNDINSSVHVSETGTVHTLCKKDRQTKMSSVSMYMLLLLLLYFPFPMSRLWHFMFVFLS